jgi:hypothetical protein
MPYQVNAASVAMAKRLRIVSERLAIRTEQLSYLVDPLWSRRVGTQIRMPRRLGMRYAHVGKVTGHSWPDVTSL